MKYRFPRLLPGLSAGLMLACLLGGRAFAQEVGEAGDAIPEPESPTIVETTEPETEMMADEPEVQTRVIPTRGDVLSMPESQSRPAPPRSLPEHGMKMDEVERRYGAPDSREPAVGQPPITRWNYPGFSVFFEHRTVLHAVQKDRPAEIYRKDELLPASTP